MIVAGHPELGLQEHQQEAYKAVTKTFETGNRASVVIPTGCGKSFISLQLMQDNKDKNILFMAPTLAIKNQMYRYIAKYIVGEEPTKGRTARQIAEEHFPNLKIMLYPTLARMEDEMMDKLNPDIIIMDELHRTGADKWGPKINTLLDKNPNAKVLGLTATPDRMDDKNVVDELFAGKIDYELTLVDAIKRGIVKPPKYVKCDYALGEMLEDIKEQIEECEDETTKKDLEDKYNKMRRIVDQADGIPELFEKNMTKKDGKYIVFCKDKEHMEQMMQEAKKWFANIDSEPEMYSVYSGDGDAKNQQTIKQFEESKSGHLKLLFSIDMLNEGLHVEDISGVIMLRPTDSRIIYLQQLGRALSSDTTREETIIFDLVNNYIKNNLDREINGKSNGEKHNKGGEGQKQQGDCKEYYDNEDIDIFRIQGETKEFLELLDEINETLARGGAYLKNARKIKKWMEGKNTTKPPSSHSKNKEEEFLGDALSRIRMDLTRPYLALKTDAEKEAYRKKYPELDEVLAIVNWIDENNISVYLENARKIKGWMEEKRTKKPPTSNSKNKEEKDLGNALSRIRNNLIRPYLVLKTDAEKEEYRKKYPELDEVLAIVNWIDENNPSPYLINAREIKAWMQERGTTKPPSKTATNEKERDLGLKLKNIRDGIIKKYIELETDDDRLKYSIDHPELEEVMGIINWIDENNISPYLINAREIKAWMEERETTKPPTTLAKDEKERDLGFKLKSLLQGIVKKYLKLEKEEDIANFRKKNPELDEILEIVAEISLNSGDKKRIELAKLIQMDREKRKMLEEARKLAGQIEKNAGSQEVGVGIS